MILATLLGLVTRFFLPFQHRLLVDKKVDSFCLCLWAWYIDVEMGKESTKSLEDPHHGTVPSSKTMKAAMYEVP